ncbi:MAG: WXG100 family type VII secretion target [Chloroflexi bacterium CFX4]|nr:WXG100 family type VII secretion target [Chloroflexi bacterium CFX4]MDL1923987.1 WXG100 family type VII secretion target [Chloroflexi bacterium CFX3]
MPSKVIQADYDFLKNTSKTFARYTDTTAALTYQLEDHYNKLYAGGWQGRAAERFFAEMKELIFPALHRLENALQLVSDEIIRTHDTFKDYEEQAARLFMGELTDIEADGGASAAEHEYLLVSNGFAKPAIMQIGTVTPTPEPTPISGQDSVYYPVLQSLLTYDYRNTRLNSEGVPYVNINNALNVANGLEQAIAEGRIDRTSVDALIASAQQGNAGALAALYTIAFANAQGTNYLAFENGTGFAYYGKSNPYLSNLTGALDGVEVDGGNCAMFVSVGLFMSGFPVIPLPNVTSIPGVVPPGSDQLWGPGRVLDYYRNSDSYSPEEQTHDGIENFFQGTDAFRGVTPLYNALINVHGTTRVTPGETGWESNIAPGTLVFSYTGTTLTAASTNHVSMVVGWGPNVANYSPPPTQPFFPTQQEAQAYYGTNVSLTPWAVDSGGETPAGYPRPYTETVPSANGTVVMVTVPIPALPVTPTQTPTPTATPAA